MTEGVAGGIVNTALAFHIDAEKVLREKGIPLFSLESKASLKSFDIVGFSLSSELCYTNVLNILDLASIPMLATERDESHPLIIAGGSCAFNPEPMADFFDAFPIASTKVRKRFSTALEKLGF